MFEKKNYLKVGTYKLHFKNNNYEINITLSFD